MSGYSTPGHNKPPGEIPCRFHYGFGKCSKGTDGGCAFAHRAPTKQEIIDYGMFKSDPAKAKGKGNDAKGKGKCAPFFQSGACKYGDKCFFSHSANAKGKGGKGKGKGGKGKKGKRAKGAPAVGHSDDWDDEWVEEWDTNDPDFGWDEVAAWDAEWAANNPP